MESTTRDHTTDPAPTGAEEPDVWRNAAVGAVIGFLVTTLATTAAGLAAGIEPGSALGLGAFIGSWGGAGFGFMMGATVPFARHLEAAHARRRTDPPPDR